jgi:hypothetical protein
MKLSASLLASLFFASTMFAEARRPSTVEPPHYAIATGAAAASQPANRTAGLRGVGHSSIAAQNDTGQPAPPPQEAGTETPAQQGAAQPTAPGQTEPGQQNPPAQPQAQGAPGQAAGQTAPGQAAPGQAAPAPAAAPPPPPVTCTPPAPTVPPAKKTWGPAAQAQQQYAAFDAAIKAPTPAAKAAAFASFVEKYPASDYRLDALGLEMQNLAAANDAAGAVKVAQQIIGSGKADLSQQLTAYYIVSEEMPELIQPNDPNAPQQIATLNQASTCGVQDLNAMVKPAGMTDQQFQQQKASAEYVMERAAGFVALQNKQYQQVKDDLAKLFSLQPQSAQQDALVNYWLALSYLYSTPPDFNNGIFYLARAVDLAPTVAAFSNYLNQVYTSHHGNTDGLQDVLTLAKTNPVMPQNFKVQSQAEIQMAQQQAQEAAAAAAAAAQPPPLPPPDTFEGMKARLIDPTSEKDEWSQLKGQAYEFDGIVVDQPTPHSVNISAAKEDQPKNIVDLHVVTAVAHHFRAGEHVTAEGVMGSYTVKPFRINLTQGKVTAKGAASSRRGR